MKAALCLALLHLVDYSTSQFTSLTPSSLTQSLERQIKDVSELLSKGTSSCKDALEPLRKEAEDVLVELKAEEELDWTENDGCKSPKCSDVLANANEISGKMIRLLMDNPDENKVETTMETSTEVSTNTVEQPPQKSNFQHFLYVMNLPSVHF